ncbi:MAG TPA: FecR family protein, partial [Sphingobacterium sp.]|nr:FecR family protein [Sphingobacterium sp.]
MYDISEIAKLIRKKLEGSIDAQKLAVLEDWAKEDPLRTELLQRLENEEVLLNDILLWLEMQEKEGEKTWVKKLEHKTFEKIYPENVIPLAKKEKRYLRILPYVASLLIIFFTGYFYFQDGFKESTLILEDLAPGANRALITLSDGRIIELSEEQEGVVFGEDLTYQDGTRISEFEQGEAIDLEISTPRGGQYQVTLDDGTKVWLNADSKLVYPSRFKEESREVEIEGEAYLEVAEVYKKGKKTPFIVKTAQQKIEVLGTQFNVKAYVEEPSVQTTLVEGAVKVWADSKELLLQPGEQSILKRETLDKRKVDIDQYLAWKNNEFIFYETELQEAMKMLSRWYDFEVVYEDGIPQTHFYGTISREKGLADVLKIMETGGVKYKIEKTADSNKLIIL